MRILYIVTHSMTAGHLLRGQLSYMRENGFEVAVAASPGPDLDIVADREGVAVFPIAISREISLFADAISLVRLVVLMRRWQPDLVNAGTPKAGLLGMLAARLIGVRARIYVLRGLRLETATGVKRFVLAMAERCASASADVVLAVSQSLADRYRALGLVPDRKLRVVASGGSNGVEVDRFARPSPEAVSALRERLDLPLGVPVVGFVGRLTRDKGIAELVDAFEMVQPDVPEARLLLVGTFEKGDPVPNDVVERIKSNPAIVHAGALNEVAPAYALMDVLAFPSHREGFPNAPIEAAAAKLPVIGFRAIGTLDAVVDGETGTLVDIGDVTALAHGMLRYLCDEELCASHGRNGHKRVQAKFSCEHIWGALLHEYTELLEEKRNTHREMSGP